MHGSTFLSVFHQILRFSSHYLPDDVSCFVSVAHVGGLLLEFFFGPTGLDSLTDECVEQNNSIKGQYTTLLRRTGERVSGLCACCSPRLRYPPELSLNRFFRQGNGTLLRSQPVISQISAAV